MEQNQNGRESGVPERPLDPAAVASAEANLLAPREERRMRRLLDALCDPTRVKILQALGDRNTLAAGDLAHVIGRSRSATSQHLKVLRDVGAVVPRRNGNVVRYTLGTDVTADVLARAVDAFAGLRTAEEPAR